jgi:STAM-binding protein
LKTENAVYRDFLKLVAQGERVLMSAEEVKYELEVLLDQESKKEKALKEEQERKLLESNKRKRAEVNEDKPKRSTSPEFDDHLLDEHLKQFRSEGVVHMETKYPELPKLIPLQAEPLQPSIPPLPPKAELIQAKPSVEPQIAPIVEEKEIEHRSIASTEGGIPLKTIFIPSSLHDSFLTIAQANTSKKLETCGILCGKLNRNAFFITHLLIPKQESTENTCQTLDEEAQFQFVDDNSVFVIGWIHTHPTQSCFLSSVDLHTQNAYQIMLRESIAIVCSPTKTPDLGIFRLSDPYGIMVISQCGKSGFHLHDERGLYKRCERVDQGHVIITRELPFEVVDLR